jgi:hypothetical protein
MTGRPVCPSPPRRACTHDSSGRHAARVHDHRRQPSPARRHALTRFLKCLSEGRSAVLQQLRQLGDVRGDAPGLVAGQQGNVSERAS